MTQRRIAAPISRLGLAASISIDPVGRRRRRDVHADDPLGAAQEAVRIFPLQLAGVDKLLKRHGVSVGCDSESWGACGGSVEIRRVGGVLVQNRPTIP